MTQSIVPTSSACAQSSAGTEPFCEKTHTPTRRTLLQGTAATILDTLTGELAEALARERQAWATLAASASATVPDAALLSLGQELVRAWAAEIAVEDMDLDEDARDHAREAAITAGSAIVDRIEAAPVTTVAGLGIKALAENWCYGIDPEIGVQPEASTGERLSFAVMLGVVQAGGPDAMAGALASFERMTRRALKARGEVQQKAQEHEAAVRAVLRPGVELTLPLQSSLGLTDQWAAQLAAHTRHARLHDRLAVLRQGAGGQADV